MHLTTDQSQWNVLTLKQLETHAGGLSTLATDAWVQKHRAFSNHSVDKIFTVLYQIFFFTKYCIYIQQHWKMKLQSKNIAQLLTG